MVLIAHSRTIRTTCVSLYLTFEKFRCGVKGMHKARNARMTLQGDYTSAPSADGAQRDRTSFIVEDPVWQGEAYRSTGGHVTNV